MTTKNKKQHVVVMPADPREWFNNSAYAVKCEDPNQGVKTLQGRGFTNTNQFIVLQPIKVITVKRSVDWGLTTEEYKRPPKRVAKDDFTKWVGKVRQAAGAEDDED